jgi:hypothetical protein
MDNDEYIPKEPNFYNYNVKQILLPELPNKMYNYKVVNVYAYTVDNDGKIPFMKFLLTKSNDEKLILPTIPIFSELDTQEFINYTIFCLFGLLMFDDFQIFNDSIEFNGFYEYNDKLYIFFDMTKCKIKINDTYRNNNLWFVLLDEIVNHKYVCNIKIDNNLCNFFFDNEEFCFLYDKVNNKYETPVVAYVGKNEEMLNFTYTFGEPKKDKNSILGPNYYFTDFYNAVIDGMEINDNKQCKHTNFGVVRFAIITGLVKYIENYHNDDIDESDIKKQRLQDTSLDQNIERLTMRISDHDGKWTKDHDTAYIGNIELDDDSYLKKNQILAVKDYSQQIPLSFHYIDKNTLGGKKEEYSII